jgi:hypothetical protein
MTTVSPHLMLATVHAARHLSGLGPSATAQIATRTASGLTLAVVVLVIGVLVAMARVVRGIVDLFSPFLQVAGAVISVLAIMVMTVVIAAALAVQH